MIHREDSWRGRLQAKLDQMAHGVVSFQSADGQGWMRHHVDGFTRRYERKPLPPRYTCPQCHRAEASDRSGKPCYECAGENRLTTRQRLYLAQVARLQNATGDFQPAHCDGRVLHAPGTCWACDLPKYVPFRELRHTLRIAYSDGVVPPGWDPCPSTAWRPAERVNRWFGNRAERAR
jgi:hypothetical protein